MAARLPVSDNPRSEVITMPNHTLEQPRHAFSIMPAFSAADPIQSSIRTKPFGTAGNEDGLA